MKLFVVTYIREGGYSGVLNHLFINEDAAKKCADWYTKHPQPFDPGITYDVDSISLNNVEYKFTPPQTEEAYAKMWEEYSDEDWGGDEYN